MGYQPFGKFGIDGENPSNRFDLLFVGTLWINKELLLNPGAMIRSVNYVPDTTGFKLNFDGTASFNGDVFVGGDIELTGNGEFRTADSAGEHISLSSHANGHLRFFSGTSAEAAPWEFTTSDIAGEPRALIKFPYGTGGAGERVQIWAGDEGSPSAYFGDGGTKALQLDFGQVLFGSGTAAAPSLSYFGDANTGTFRLGADVLGWSAGGTERFRMSTAGFYHNATGGPYLKTGASTAAAPAYAFTDDGDLGLHRAGANDGRLVAGGNSIAQFNTTRFGPGTDNTINLGNSSFRWATLYAQLIYSLGSYSNTTGSAANVFINSLGRLYRSTSSSRYKEQVQPVDLAHINLRPVQYMHRGDRKLYYGFIAEDLAAEDALLVVTQDGEVESYDDRALSAVLAAKMNNLSERVSQLEAALC